ncbi:MAG TPA: site-specific integrase [Candidatus Angelobacter sp.]|jgi:integrase|nr:site-specific integrase [Candidatus Angelobacter sp.]
MARRRYQNPKPKRHGNQWRILVWKDVFENGDWNRKRVPHVLGAVNDIGFREAQQRAAAVMDPLNLQPRSPGVAVTFRHFVDDVYKKIFLPVQSKAHADRYEGILENHLLPAFGDIALFDLARPTDIEVQKYFIGLKDKNLAHASMSKMLSCFSTVMQLAVEQSYVSVNPAGNVVLPRAKVGRAPKPNITPEQAAAVLELVAEPYATMIFVAVNTGLLPSEIAALRWKDILEDAIVIDEKCCRGDWGAPKTDARNTVLAVSPHVIQRIHRLKELSVVIGGGRGGYQTFKLVKRSEPDDLVFQSVRKGVVMRDNNILSRHIKPAARKLGIPFVNWRCFRTSFATWMKRAGIPVRDAQGQMRHARASTTIDIYQQTSDEHQRDAVRKLDSFTRSTTVQ